MAGQEDTPPIQVGPYRILKLLGAGGMGTVYEAFDERLKRRVAIKRIRPRRAVAETARRRFRREAQAVAQISHPAIVQIFDLVEAEEGDWIVMELIEGTPLDRRIRQGPVGVEEAIRWGSDIASGLAAAHEKDVVHRDLKTENVVVTREGRAKVLDFGLAKLLAGAPDLSQDGALIGTSRAMSPEQVQGHAVDARSDLFSFGTLLYETLTGGSSPFAGASQHETRERVLSYPQRPVREVNPRVPAELSSLIDGLLSKEPAQRPASASDVARRLAASTPSPGDASGARRRIEADSDLMAATLPQEGWEPSARRRSRGWALWAAGFSVLAMFAALALWFPSAPEETAYVAVLAPRIDSGAELEGVDLVASGVRLALQRGLLALRGRFPMSNRLVDGVSPAGAPRELVRALLVDEVVASSLACESRACSLTLERLGRDGQVLWTDRVEVPIDAPSLTAAAVASLLHQAYGDVEPRPGVPRLEAGDDDYASFLRLRRSFEERDPDTDLESIQAAAARIRRSTSGFLDLLLFEAEVSQRRFVESGDTADLELALTRLEEAQELDPGAFEPRLRRVKVALDAGDLELAAASLSELKGMEPGNPEVLIAEASLLQRQGRGREALDLMQSAAERRPSAVVLYNAASVAYRLGDVAAARRHLDLLLERAPHYFSGRFLLAQIELLSGSADRAAALYEELAQRAPSLLVLSNLGLAHCLLGRYDAAAEAYRAALELAPDHAGSTLNLADAELLRGRDAEAEALYRKVVELSDSVAAADDAKALTLRAQALAHLGRAPEAVADVQRALRLAPDHPEVVYEASLVYALTHEPTSALVNAGRALDLGVEPRWFSFPWFEALRSQPAFRRRLEGTGRNELEGRPR